MMVVMVEMVWVDATHVLISTLRFFRAEVVDMVVEVYLRGC